MKVRLIDNKCMVSKGYIDDGGWDLKARESVGIAPFETVVIPTGICIAIPRGYTGDIRPRSSVSSRGLLIHYGTVDHGYIGEIKVTITNISMDYKLIEQYERIAQIVITKINEDNSIEVLDKLSESPRGVSGFGSTGKR